MCGVLLMFACWLLTMCSFFVVVVCVVSCLLFVGSCVLCVVGVVRWLVVGVCWVLFVICHWSFVEYVLFVVRCVL